MENKLKAVRGKIAVVVSADMTIKAFLLGHLKALASCFETSVLVNTGDLSVLSRYQIPARVLPVRIVRPIRPFADLLALFEIIRYFRRYRFDGIFSVTPKAGLLSMMAGAITRIPVRIHIFTGQVWATKRGPMRFLLKSIDSLTAILATDILVDSESQRQFLISEGVVSAQKSQVLASGSISGVDLQRFRPNQAAWLEIRRELGVAPGQVLLVFIGRLNRDKGVLDLAAAFSRLAAQHPSACLLFVGPDEGYLREEIRALCASVSGRLHFVDYTHQPENYMAAADVFCLPSYREGFGSVVIEAAAVGVPAVASRIYGLTDAVIDGQTGLLHAPGDICELVECLGEMVDSADLRRRCSVAAQERVEKEFSAERLTAALLAYVCERLGGGAR